MNSNRTDLEENRPRRVEPNSRKLEFGSEKLHVLVGGEGPPLLLLHDAGSAGAWLPVHEILAQRFTVYAPDHPGFGGSSDFPELDSIVDIAALYIDLIDRLELARPLTVMGMSFGGWIAAEMAARHPGKFDFLVLVNAVGLEIPDHPIKYQYDAGMDWTINTLFHDPSVFASLMPAEPTAEFIEAVQRNAASFARFARASNCQDPALPSLLSNVTASTLVLWGALDKLVHIEHGKEYARLIPGADFREVGDCGHAAAVEQPRWVADNVITHTGSSS